MTLGEYRVGISFNPSNNRIVDDIKRAAADLIDLCAGERAGPRGDSEVTRLWNLAMDAIETAAMHAVKAATKQPM